jgi:hypothetical protein
MIDSRDILEAVYLEIAERLARGEEVHIEGLIRFVIHTYGGYETRNPRTGEKVHVPERKQARACLSDAWMTSLRDDGPPPNAFAAPELVGPVAERLQTRSELIADALEASLRATVEALWKDRYVQPLGWLGWLTLDAISRSTGFQCSQRLDAFVAGEPAPATIPSDDVSRVLAAYAPAEIAGAGWALRVLDRIGVPRRSPGRMQRLPKNAPRLLREIFASHDFAGSDAYLPARIVDDEDERSELLREHKRLMSELHEPAGVPFANEANGDSWCYCPLHPADDDVWVFLAGPDTPSRHRHDLTFSGWLAASALIGEVSKLGAPGERVLTPEDLSAVLRRLQALAPSARTLLIDLPF